MNGNRIKVVSWLQTLMLGACIAGVIGCTSIHSYYPIVPHSRLPQVSSQALQNGPTVALQWDFQTNGKSRQAVTDKWAAHVREAIGKAGAFPRVNSSGVPSDCTLSVTMNNVVDSLAGAIGQGVLSGLTFGLIGAKVTDDYVCTATLTQKAGKGGTKEYKYAITSTSGLIVGGVAGVSPKKNVDDAFAEILDQFLLKCIADFQQDGSLQKQ